MRSTFKIYFIMILVATIWFLFIDGGGYRGELLLVGAGKYFGGMIKDGITGTIDFVIDYIK